MAQTIIYNSVDGSGFLLKDVPSTVLGKSIGGYAILTPTYLEENKLYGKSVQVIHSWNHQGPVLQATFTSSIYDSNRVNKFGEPAPTNVGMAIINGSVVQYYEDFC